MKRGIMALAICMVVAVLAMLAAYHSTQAQDRPGGMPRRPPAGRAMMARMLPLESSWSHICFELDVSDDVLPALRKIYKHSWSERKKLGNKMSEARDDRAAMQAIRADAEALKADTAKKLKGVLTAEQMEKLTKWEKRTQSRMRRPPGPPSGQLPGQ